MKLPLRPFRFWLPETLNRLGAPAFIMRRARRNEIAQTVRQARRDGLGWLIRDKKYPLTAKLFGRAPAK